MCPPPKGWRFQGQLCSHDKHVLGHDRAEVYCFSPNCTGIQKLMDATRILKDSQEGIPTHNIVNCWLNANILPPTHSDELGNVLGKVHVEDSNALDGLQSCIQSIQVMDVFPTKN